MDDQRRGYQWGRPTAFNHWSRRVVLWRGNLGNRVSSWWGRKCLLNIRHFLRSTNRDCISIRVEGKAQAPLHWSTAVVAGVDAAAQPPPLGSVDAGAAAGDPGGQVPGHGAPVEVLGDLSLADALAVMTPVVVEPLQDVVYLKAPDTGSVLTGLTSRSSSNTPGFTVACLLSDSSLSPPLCCVEPWQVEKPGCTSALHLEREGTFQCTLSLDCFRCCWVKITTSRRITSPMRPKRLAILFRAFLLFLLSIGKTLWLRYLQKQWGSSYYPPYFSHLLLSMSLWKSNIKGVFLLTATMMLS